MVVYHTRYRNDWQRSKDNRVFVFFHQTTFGSTDRFTPPVFQLTLSVNTTPIFHTWYFVSMELSLEIESSAVIFDLFCDVFFLLFFLLSGA